MRAKLILGNDKNIRHVSIKKEINWKKQEIYMKLIKSKKLNQICAGLVNRNSQKIIIDDCFRLVGSLMLTAVIVKGLNSNKNPSDKTQKVFEIDLKDPLLAVTAYRTALTVIAVTRSEWGF